MPQFHQKLLCMLCSSSLPCNSFLNSCVWCSQGLRVSSFISLSFNSHWSKECSRKLQTAKFPDHRHFNLRICDSSLSVLYWNVSWWWRARANILNSAPFNRLRSSEIADIPLYHLCGDCEKIWASLSERVGLYFARDLSDPNPRRCPA